MSAAWRCRKTRINLIRCVANEKKRVTCCGLPSCRRSVRHLLRPCFPRSLPPQLWHRVLQVQQLAWEGTECHRQSGHRKQFAKQHGSQQTQQTHALTICDLYDFDHNIIHVDKMISDNARAFSSLCFHLDKSISSRRDVSLELREFLRGVRIFSFLLAFQLLGYVPANGTNTQARYITRQQKHY